MDVPAISGPSHPHQPRIATDLAILDEAPPHIVLDKDLHFFPAIGTDDGEFFVV